MPAVAAHCATCAAYESAVMGRKPGEALPEDLAPCADYVMSDAFRDWTVAQMRGEVSRQLARSGLNRMAIVKSPKSGLGGQPADGEEEKKGRDADADAELD